MGELYEKFSVRIFPNNRSYRRTKENSSRYILFEILTVDHYIKWVIIQRYSQQQKEKKSIEGKQVERLVTFSYGFYCLQQLPQHKNEGKANENDNGK